MVVMYVATGDAKYQLLARHSLHSLRMVWPDVTVMVVTDASEMWYNDPVIRGDRRIAVAAMPSSGFGYLDKVRAIRHYGDPGGTVFLDADTHVCAPFPEVFDVLERYDLALNREVLLPPQEGLPSAFIEYSTGIFGYSANPRVQALLCDWHVEMERLWEAGLRCGDQQPFRKLLWEYREIRVATLPDEYNFRPRTPVTVQGQVKIIHLNAKGMDPLKMARLLNQPRNGKRLLGYLGRRDQPDVLIVKGDDADV